jgi:predicted dithiol-disulfide oxidoreductase (DUF899 family)
MNEITELEARIAELQVRLGELRAAAAPEGEVPDFEFEGRHGPLRLSQLFAGRERLFAIHNMGVACRWCTLWADGLNGLLPHLEDRHAVVLLSKDPPELQQRFAHSRGWRFPMASHGGGAYLRDQSVLPGGGNMPGVVVYRRQGDRILRQAAAPFGPGDLYCALWPLLSLAGLAAEAWGPQYRYWTPPAAEAMEDGGEDLRP